MINTLKRIIFACAAQWALADELRGLPLRLKTTTLLISHWLNNNSISCLHNSTSCDLWPLIGQNVVHYPVSFISFSIPAMEYYFLSVRKIFNSSQKCDSNYCFLKNTKITDLWLANNSVSCFILLPVPCGWKTISCVFNFLDLELQHFSHDLSFDMSTYDSFHSYWRK